MRSEEEGESGGCLGADGEGNKGGEWRRAVVGEVGFEAGGEGEGAEWKG